MDNKVDGKASLGWQDLYEEAVLEMDPARLLSRIEEARRAILQQLDSTAPHDHNQAELLTNALQVLKDLDRIYAQDGKAGAA